jgi:hypothetical protein
MYCGAQYEVNISRHFEIIRRAFIDACMLSHASAARAVYKNTL